MISHLNRPAHIVFVEQFYYPEGWGGAQIPQDITTMLAEPGRVVTVLCGKEQYVAVQGSGQSDPRDAGVRIRYVPRYRIGRRNGKSALAQLWFSVATAFMLLTRRRPSMLIVQTNPPLIVVAMSLVARIFRTPLIIIAQDLYPEVMIAHGMIAPSGVVGRFLGVVFRFAYSRAAKVVSLGPRMTTRLLDKGVAAERICEISNWATGDLPLIRGSANALKGEWGLSGKFVLLYSGNMGTAHDPGTIIRAIAAARTVLRNLRLVIVGQGGRISQAKCLAKDLGIEDLVLFKDLVPSGLLPQTLGMADLALVTLLPGFEGLVVPSKVLGYMARGIPTLYVGPSDGDVAEWVANSGGGVAIRNGEVDQLASRLIELVKDPQILERMGSCAKEYYAEHLSREFGLSRYRALVDGVLHTGQAEWGDRSA
jgi:colanic acid biosynthesis glycosyl transferase WcaI